MDSPRWISLLLLMVCCPSLLGAAQIGGQVRAADQIVPGATVTALQGGAKVTAFTDENGRYTLELTPGVWQIEVSMFEFTTAKGEVTVSDGAIARDWVLNMPKLSERGGAAATAPATSPLPAAPGIGRGGRGARGNRGADGQRAYGDFPGRQGRGGPGTQDAQGGPGGR
ncbi:MAG: carboxypeptidase-like regulatory domain-containing protein, partial [Candidatus Solibacter sp.]